MLSRLVAISREIQTEDGNWYVCRIFPYRTKENHIAGVVITFVNITERKLVQNALSIAKLNAETANLGKSHFLAAASHDLRQPLQALVLLQDVLAIKLKDRDELQYVVRSQEALSAMSGMLNTLLDINQLEAGVIRPEIVEFSIDSLLQRMESEFAYHAQVHKLDWRVRPCKFTVRSDPRLLEQMIRNLLSNGIKYTRKGGILLGCRRRGDKLRIEVWDTGLGIPEGQIKEIFREFYQVDNPARETNLGLGLGLSIVQRLGDLLSHKIDVRSRHGTGSVFGIEVPLAQVAQRPTLLNVEPNRDMITNRRGLILIIEDDSSVRDALESLLSTDGHQIMTAADGEEAIALVAGKGVRPDTVVVDYNLSRGLTGIQIVTRLRKMLKYDVPALILTADISTETLAAIDRGGYVHHSKPINAISLAPIIERLLAEPRPAPDARVTLPERVTGVQSETVFVVDDDSGVREAIRVLLQSAGMRVEVYANGEEFVDAYLPGSAGCLLVDARMPGMSGFDLMRRLKDEGYQLPSIMITGHGDVRMAVQAMKSGADDFIEKPVSGDELLTSIQRASEKYRNLSKLSVEGEAAAARLKTLTARQREILDSVLNGTPSKNIAADLGLSQRTVESHRAAIMEKMGAKSMPALVRLVMAAI